MPRELRWYDPISINIYFTGLTTLSQTMTPLVVPLLVQQFVGEARQGAFYGTARLWSLMTALLVQALMGMLSDRSRMRLGRRRPFILAGTLGDLLVVSAIGFTAGLQGLAGFWVLFLLLILLQITSNTAQAAAQGLIPDLVPEKLRGRYSGIKAILEVPIPLILVSFTIGRLVAAGSLWAALAICMAVLVFTMLVTMLVPEKAPSLEHTPPLDWQPFVRLLAMSVVFTGLLLLMGRLVKVLAAVLAGSALDISLAIMGGVGLLLMCLTVAAGVWLSIQISLGSSARRYPSFTWWVVNRLAFLVGSTNVASFTIFYLQGKLGLAREAAAAPASQLLMFVGLFILLLGFPAGWMADRLGRKPLVAASGVIAALGTLVLVLAPSMAAISLGAIMVGAGIGLFYTASWALGTDLVPRAESGRFLGISNLAGAGAGAVGAYIGGPIADFFTVHHPALPGLGYVLLYAVFGLLFVFSVLVLGKVRLIHNRGDSLPGASIL